ncbi:amino acid permease [Methylacidiphilum caldifontis]|uniref:APC family permease n=2 Tax=Methylacidiphilum caldifontis TaxID=2795386 RepID=UPI001A8D7A3B|nr:amino acid permease [Methylacidiphilum caldifontis]QSR88645.1 amino acid permease [Methylacidiphilum caldifontis]
MIGFKKISPLTAFSIVVANMIGTGVFTTVGFQIKEISSPFVILSIWVMGGIIALSGALCYAELGAIFQRSGGEYLFLSKIYHPIIGFLAGWLSVTVGFAAPSAATAMAMGKYFSYVFPGIPPLWISLFLSIFVYVFHLLSVRWESIFQNIFIVIEMGLILFFIFYGFGHIDVEKVNLLPQAGDFSVFFSPPFALCFIYTLYSYSGWNAAAYIAGEIKNPKKNIPLSLILGTTVVMIIYSLLNALFVFSVPKEQISGQIEVGAIVARQIFGNWGSRFAGFLIGISLLSSLSAMAWTGPRVAAAIGEDYPIFKILSKRSSKGVPYMGLILQALIMFSLLLSSSFARIITYVEFSLGLSTVLTVAGVIVLRFKEPTLKRFYSTWGYPFTPLLYVIVESVILLQVFRQRPIESLLGLSTFALGIIVYFFSVKRTAP